MNKLKHKLENPASDRGVTGSAAIAIMLMPYGTGTQIDASDAYMMRFMKLFQACNFQAETCRVDWLAQALETTQRELMFTDVFNLAKKRWNYRQWEAQDAIK